MSSGSRDIFRGGPVKKTPYTYDLIRIFVPKSRSDVWLGQKIKTIVILLKIWLFYLCNILTARAVTGRWCTHSGEGEDFLTTQSFFFTKTAITRERKVEKSLPTWEMNSLSEGYKWAIDQNWGCIAKIGFLDQKPRFGAEKKESLLGIAMFWPRPEKLFKEKSCLCPNNYHPKYHFGWFFGVKPIFRPKTTFRPNVKTPVSP